MIEVKINMVEYNEPYNDEIEESICKMSVKEIENHPYFKFKSQHYSIIRFNSEQEFRQWFDKDYRDLLDYEHWLEEGDDGLTYVSWDRGVDLNFDIALKVTRYSYGK